MVNGKVALTSETQGHIATLELYAILSPLACYSLACEYSFPCTLALYGFMPAGPVCYDGYVCLPAMHASSRDGLRHSEELVTPTAPGSAFSRLQDMSAHYVCCPSNTF